MGTSWRQAAPEIDCVTVGAGDTVESLAARMAVKDEKLDWFRVLNGMSATDAAQVGEKVKVVVVE